MKTINLRLDDELHAMLKEAATARRLTLLGYIRSTLAEAVKASKPNTTKPAEPTELDKPAKPKISPTHQRLREKAKDLLERVREHNDPEDPNVAYVLTKLGNASIAKHYEDAKERVRSAEECIHHYQLAT